MRLTAAKVFLRTAVELLEPVMSEWRGGRVGYDNQLVTLVGTIVRSMRAAQKTLQIATDPDEG